MMALSKEERKGFDKLIHEVFVPVATECGEELNKLLQEDSEMKSQVENKMKQIIENRNKKKI